MAMTEIPEYSSSDPERGEYDEKKGGEKGAGFVVEETLAESEVIEFGETKELRYFPPFTFSCLRMVSVCVWMYTDYGIGRRGLGQRHIQMIALAGTIGTGLFLGSGKALARGGPLGAL